jgi:hypothetical protein
VFGNGKTIDSGFVGDIHAPRRTGGKIDIVDANAILRKRFKPRHTIQLKGSYRLSPHQPGIEAPGELGVRKFNELVGKSKIEVMDAGA